jgi:general secretion pathway protein E
MKNNLESYIIDYSLIEKLNLNYIKDNKIIPINKYDLYILVAVVDNINKEKLVVAFDYPIKIINISDEVFNSFLINIEKKIDIYNSAIKSINVINKKDTNISEISVFLENLLSLSINRKASDIHIEAYEDKLVIRYRINGVLENIFNFDFALYKILSSVIKSYSSLDISLFRLPQNGSFSSKINNINYDFRVSILPNTYGESIVIRILDNKNAKIKLNQIGFDDSLFNIINKNINQTQGLILVTGPTGSGKTTTLYSMLNSINKQDKKIITIEDPVEYKLDDITQVSINNDIGLTYEVVLKNILRQDPDVIMIGEIRDEEALSIAIQAALTGHIVIATLHTNDAIKTISRLFDLKAKPFLVASVLKLVISQRLYRNLCKYCTKKDANFYKEVGCEKCNYTGYSSRNIIAQYLQITKENEKYIQDENSISKLYEDINIKSLNEYLYEKVLDGTTSLSEYYKNEI